MKLYDDHPNFSVVVPGNCNPGIGFFKDDQKLLQKAIEYLRRYSSATEK